MTEKTRQHILRLLESEIKGNKNRADEVRKWLDYHKKYDYDKMLEMYGKTIEEYEAEQMERIARYTARIEELQEMYREI
jgi:uncharacterized protein (DUF488 family)